MKYDYKYIESKQPFHMQLTHGDCVAFTFLNMVAFLFKRSEVPPLAIRMIFSQCLDVINLRGHSDGNGTSSDAIYYLASALPELFKKKGVRLISEVLYEEDVTEEAMAKCISKSGAVLLNAVYSRRSWHYILLLGIVTDNDGKTWFLCFDSAQGPRFREETGELETILSDQIGPNLRISRDRMLSENLERYSLGGVEDREIVLTNRT